MASAGPRNRPKQRLHTSIFRRRASPANLACHGCGWDTACWGTPATGASRIGVPLAASDTESGLTSAARCVDRILAIGKALARLASPTSETEARRQPPASIATATATAMATVNRKRKPPARRWQRIAEYALVHILPVLSSPYSGWQGPAFHRGSVDDARHPYCDTAWRARHDPHQPARRVPYPRDDDRSARLDRKWGRQRRRCRPQSSGGWAGGEWTRRTIGMDGRG